jgi:hypothetical protein
MHMGKLDKGVMDVSWWIKAESSPRSKTRNILKGLTLKRKERCSGVSKMNSCSAQG